ncbi:MAG TPA: serine/threonine-protein kinase, partial [Thermoanaerobaculia bacterium]|nr:serine/threonine-protein kinase [Thermoanaerobaculia bacterium]
MQISRGVRLGPYEIMSMLGAGGMGEVWRARDARLDRDVAVKVLPAEFAANAQLRLRFEREARAISKLSHPNICALYDVGETDGVNYLVMELLEGETLAERIGRGALQAADVLRIGGEIASALEKAHRAHFVHRDLKPANVMLTKSGTKLLDFGLAKAMEIAADADAPTQHRITSAGFVVGTPQYMAPEQVSGGTVDHRCDIFALGAVLYEMATGRAAFEGGTYSELARAILTDTPPPPGLSPALDHVILKCLEKDPDERWQSAHDVA